MCLVRSVQAATRYAWEQSELFTAVSSLTGLQQLEVSQPAVTPDLLLLRLFYRDVLHTFPQLRTHDLVWRCVEGEYSTVQYSTVQYSHYLDAEASPVLTLSVC